MKAHNLAVRIKCILALLALMVIDILPVPVIATIGLYVVFFRPRWFIEVVDALYER